MPGGLCAGSGPDRQRPAGAGVAVRLNELEDVWAALRGEGPAVDARWWPASLRAAYPRRQLREAWTGPGAAFARYATPAEPLFLKYLPLGWRDPRAYRRMARELGYLRDLAPLCPVAHAPLLHAALDRERRQAHLLTPDLTERTTGWGHFQTDPERTRALEQVAGLLARFHAFWAGPDGQGHPALTGPWSWSTETLLAQAGEVARPPDVMDWDEDGRAADERKAVQDAAGQLAGLLAGSRVRTLVHGDIHSGQVLWPRDGTEPVLTGPILIDYGQVHPSIPGEDLAHLLYVRLSAGERAMVGDAMRAAYWDALAAAGLRLSPAEQRQQERAGLALNLLATARQAQARSGHEPSGAALAYREVTRAWLSGAGLA